MSSSRPSHDERQLAKAPSAQSQSLDWLSRFSQDAQNQSTAIGAFLAAMPEATKRTAKSSSERGKAFRERQRQQEERLEKYIALLKGEIAHLHMRRSARVTRCLNTRTSLTGSLVQATHEYHRLFRHGLLELPDEAAIVGSKRGMLDDGVAKHVQLQEEFVRRTLDETATVGDAIGPEASIIQWRRYTQSHESLTLEMDSVRVLTAGDDEADDDEDREVTVAAHCTLRVRLSHATFRNMFPHVLKDEAFLQRMVGKDITYAVVRSMQYASDGRVVTERVEVDFVGGLVKAGVSLADLAFLMGGSAITSESMIVEVDAVEEDAMPVQLEATGVSSVNEDDLETCSPPRSFDLLSDEDSDTLSKPPRRLSVAYILSDAA